MSDIRSVIENDFRDDPLRDALERTVRFVEQASIDELRIITLNRLSEIAAIPVNDGALARLSSIVCSTNLPILELQFFYQSGEDEYRVSNAEIADAKKVGFMVDPTTGHKDDQYQKHLYPFFQANKKVLASRSKT